MKEKRLNEIKKELATALMYFKELNKEELDEIVGKKMQKLKSSTSYALTIDGELMIGQYISIATERTENQDALVDGQTYEHEKLRTVLLFVNEKKTKYIIRTAECYSRPSIGEIAVGDVSYEPIELTEVSGDFQVSNN